MKTLLACMALATAAAALGLLAPKPPPYDAQLATAWGHARARDGVGTLNFEQHTSPPVMFLNVERAFPGMSLTGEVEVTGWVTSSAGMTMTAAADADSPTSMMLTMPCVPVEPPTGAPATVSGTIQTVNCPSDQSGCILTGPITELAGNRCP